MRILVMKRTFILTLTTLSGVVFCAVLCCRDSSGQAEKSKATSHDDEVWEASTRSVLYTVQDEKRGKAAEKRKGKRFACLLALDECFVIVLGLLSLFLRIRILALSFL